MTFLLGGNGSDNAEPPRQWAAEDKEVNDHDLMEGRKILKYINVRDTTSWCAQCCGYTVYGLGCVICGPASEEDDQRYRGVYEPDRELLYSR